MDDEEDFQALFFIECEENLSDLQTRLDALLAGDREAETVNAAFRAVHSVKGGASAFGFTNLVGFAHEFETVMDRVRGGTLDLTPQVCEVLLRSGDVMAGLVEATRSGSDGASDRVTKVLAQLADLIHPGSGAAVAQAAPAAAPAPAVEILSPLPQPDAEPEYVEAMEVTVQLVPRADFLLAGFDPIRMIRAARAFGLVSSKAEGTVPPIQDYVVGDCPLSLKMEFELDGPLSELRSFLVIYSHGADVTMTSPHGTEEVVPLYGAEMPADTARAAPPPEPKAPEAAPVVIEAPKPQEVKPAPVEAAAPAPAPIPEAPPKAAAKEGAEPGKQPAAAAPRSLRVDLDRVDRLVNLVGEVLIAQAAVAQGVSDVEGVETTTLRPLVETLSRQTRELQESVMAIRAQPVRTVFGRLPRVVRDLADMLGKDARLVMQGEDVEVDTTVIEELTEPLVHMLRNAMDHGLETPEERITANKPKVGTLTLTAEQRGGVVQIVMSDDGRGINREVVLAKAKAKGLVAPDEVLDIAAIENLIFHPGFSTAAQISAVSGRGVGMDVVRRKIQMLGGRCVVAGNPGHGTTFTITLPLTLAVMDGMAVRVDDQQFILPVSNVVEAIAIEPGVVQRLPDGGNVIKLRDAFLPVYSLREALYLPDADPGASTAVVIDTEACGQVVVLVDALLGQRQVVLKSLESNVGPIEGVGGATILGDGSVALVLDIAAFFRLGPKTVAEFERAS